MRSRLLLGALALTVLLASCSQPAASTTPTKTTAEPTTELAPEPTVTVQPTREPTAVFEEAPCPFDMPQGVPVQCGFVTVPEDHNDPTGPTIRLAVAILKDQSPGHQPDAVILLAGGPGEKKVASALTVAPILASMYPNRDLVIFDQRGVGLSEPALECPEFLEAHFDVLDEPDPDATARAIFDAFMACRDRLLSEGHNLSAYNTIQNAADVNAIRIALGYDQVNLHGGSYGSLLAQATMRDYPEGIRSVVINSVLPLEKSFSVEASTATANAIMRMLNACASDAACHNAYPDLQNVLFEVVERLNAEPIPITVTNPLDSQTYPALLSGDAVLGNLLTFLYVTQIVPVLPQAIYNVHNQDYSLMTQLSSTRLALLDLLSRGVNLSVLCSDDLIGRTPEDLLEIRAALPQQLVGSASPQAVVEYGIFGMCKNWPVEEAAPSVKEPLVSDIPTLVLEGEFDPVTPPEYGQLVASHLANSHFFEFAGVGHDVLSNECARTIAGAFVKDPTQAPEAACLAEEAGVVFDLPSGPAAVVLEPFTDMERGFKGVVPAGWQELQPANLARGRSTLDPAYFVLEATPGTAAELFAVLAGQLALDPGLEPVQRAEVGSFTWDLYAFESQGNPVDLGLAEDGEKAYFVLLVSPADEHDVLYEQLFLPAVEAMVASP
jgi:pimeloyl-ACP methyl ester carboxylesterase